jgi:hypothetical protein
MLYPWLYADNVPVKVYDPGFSLALAYFAEYFKLLKWLLNNGDSLKEPIEGLTVVLLYDSDPTSFLNEQVANKKLKSLKVCAIYYCSAYAEFI